VWAEYREALNFRAQCYSSSKAALCGLTECLAEEFKGKNIAFNCLALGAVQTEMLSKAFPGYKAPLQPKQMAEYICNFALTGQNYFNGKNYFCFINNTIKMKKSILLFLLCLCGINKAQVKFKVELAFNT